MLLQQLLMETRHHFSHEWEELQTSEKSGVSDLCSTVPELSNASLTRRCNSGKSCLSVRTAFDPLHFLHETLNHAIAPSHAAPIGNSLRIVSQ